MESYGKPWRVIKGLRVFWKSFGNYRKPLRAMGNFEELWKARGNYGKLKRVWETLGK